MNFRCHLFLWADFVLQSLAAVLFLFFWKEMAWSINWHHDLLGIRKALNYGERDGPHLPPTVAIPPALLQCESVVSSRDYAIPSGLRTWSAVNLLSLLSKPYEQAQLFNFPVLCLLSNKSCSIVSCLTCDYAWGHLPSPCPWQPFHLERIHVVGVAIWKHGLNALWELPYENKDWMLCPEKK